MRLSTVFELLLIFLFLALASSKHIDKRLLKKSVTKQSNLNPYCTCSELQCNCCRDFPVVPIKGPGCASLGYKSGDSLQLTMSFGDRVLRNITLVGKRPKPVCMGLPGGISKFCGRLYNVQRLNDQFKACLSLELRALDELEAALRVSCFNFGPKGVKLEPGAPLPSAAKPAEEDDDDDDYDLEEDDDDDDDEFDDDDDEYNDVDTDGDYTGFAALSDQLFEGFFFPTAETSSGNKKKKPVRPVVQEETIDVVPEITTKSGVSVGVENKEVSTTLSPEIIKTSTSVPSTTVRQLEIKGPSTVITPTTISTTAPPQKGISEKTESTEQSTDSPSTEADVTTEAEDEKDNETEDSESTEDVSDQKEVEEDDISEATDREDEDSNEGSAEDELEEEKTKQEDEEGEDEDDEDSEEEEEHESAEQEESLEETKNDDNILNVFFEDSNESEQEKARKEREKLQKILPGLMELLKPSPTPPSESAFAYPAVRSARVHRRMRLPPI